MLWVYPVPPFSPQDAYLRAGGGSQLTSLTFDSIGKSGVVGANSGKQDSALSPWKEGSSAWSCSSKGSLSCCVGEQVRSTSSVASRPLGGDVGGELWRETRVFLSMAPLAKADIISLSRWIVRVAEMESLTGGSSFLGVAESLEAVFFTFGAAFSLVLEGFRVLRKRET